MAAQLRVVRRRIRTVQSTQKITRAFELISASRVVRAQQRVEASRPYTNQVTQALTSVANTEVTISHPLLEPRAEVRAAGILVITSDRGLAGPYNANVLRTAAELMARLQADGVEPTLYVPGRQGVAHRTVRRRSGGPGAGPTGSSPGCTSPAARASPTTGSGAASWPTAGPAWPTGPTTTPPSRWPTPCCRRSWTTSST